MSAALCTLSRLNHVLRETTRSSRWMLICRYYRKFSNNDGHGDPTAFFNDIRTCLRLPSCDQLMILDCCYAAKAFAREHIGKRKFELLTSSAHDLKSPAPHLAHSFTRALYESLKRLIKENPKGFCTSHLYREVYHTMPPSTNPLEPDPRPLLFDQARHSFGRIWLRPQVVTAKPPKASKEEEGRYLKLTFRLNQSPDLAVMNELALHLQFLPHVDQLRFEDLYAPKEQITDFMTQVLRASKLRPLVRRLQARRQRRKILALVGQTTPSSLIKLHLENSDRPACDWSSAEHVKNHNPSTSQELQDERKKRKTWPVREPSSNDNLSSDRQIPTEYIVDVLEPRHVSPSFTLSTEGTNQLPYQNHQKRQRSASLSLATPPGKVQKVDH